VCRYANAEEEKARARVLDRAKRAIKGDLAASPKKAKKAAAAAVPSGSRGGGRSGGRLAGVAGNKRGTATGATPKAGALQPSTLYASTKLFHLLLPLMKPNHPKP
jgi:hypothetical protein